MDNLSNLGHWAFLLGVLLAVLAGFANIPSLPVILFVLGLIVGFLNVGEKESTSFLVSVIALLVIGVAGLQSAGLAGLSDVLVSVISNFVAFVSAAGLIVALKQVLSVAKAG